MVRNICSFSYSMVTTDPPYNSVFQRAGRSSSGRHNMFVTVCTWLTVCDVYINFIVRGGGGGGGGGHNYEQNNNQTNNQFFNC